MKAISTLILAIILSTLLSAYANDPELGSTEYLKGIKEGTIEPDEKFWQWANSNPDKLSESGISGEIIQNALKSGKLDPTAWNFDTVSAYTIEIAEAGVMEKLNVNDEMIRGYMFMMFTTEKSIIQKNRKGFDKFSKAEFNLDTSKMDVDIEMTNDGKLILDLKGDISKEKQEGLEKLVLDVNNRASSQGRIEKKDEATIEETSDGIRITLSKFALNNMQSGDIKLLEDSAEFTDATGGLENQENSLKVKGADGTIEDDIITINSAKELESETKDNKINLKEANGVIINKDSVEIKSADSIKYTNAQQEIGIDITNAEGYKEQKGIITLEKGKIIKTTQEEEGITKSITLLDAEGVIIDTKKKKISSNIVGSTLIDEKKIASYSLNQLIEIKPAEGEMINFQINKDNNNGKITFDETKTLIIDRDLFTDLKDSSIFFSEEGWQYADITSAKDKNTLILQQPFQKDNSMKLTLDKDERVILKKDNKNFEIRTSDKISLESDELDYYSLGELKQETIKKPILENKIIGKVKEDLFYIDREEITIITEENIFTKDNKTLVHTPKGIYEFEEDIRSISKPLLLDNEIYETETRLINSSPESYFKIEDKEPWSFYIENGEFILRKDFFNEHIYSPNIAEGTYGSNGIICFQIESPGGYYFSDADPTRDFGIIAKEEKFSFCLEKKVIDNDDKNKNNNDDNTDDNTDDKNNNDDDNNPFKCSSCGKINFQDKILYLHDNVRYLRYPLISFSISSFFLEDVFDLYNNTRLKGDFDEYMIDFKSIIITGLETEKTSDTFQGNKLYIINETTKEGKRKRILKIQPEYKEEILIEKYESDDLIIRLNNRNLIQETKESIITVIAEDSAMKEKIMNLR
jgi:hypothetical protein